jgi:hypothetical protein
MKRLLLKRNGSMTMTPLQELLSSIRKQRLEEGKEGAALVEQFLSELREAEVKTPKGEGSRWNDNHYRIEQGEAGVEVSLHGSGLGARQGWWGVGVNYVNTVEKWDRHWGVVLLAPKERFWIDGRDFPSIVTGNISTANTHELNLPRLRKSPLVVIPFSSVREFLSISGLR